MLLFLTTFLAILPSILRSRAALELENLALRDQIDVLQRSAAKRPKLTSGDRRELFSACIIKAFASLRSSAPSYDTMSFAKQKARTRFSESVERKEIGSTIRNLKLSTLQRLPTNSSFGAPGERSARISRIGGWPKKRLYSRLNC